jgi:photosystem II stability/assembly factor-like uncharacterized protein
MMRRDKIIWIGLWCVFFACQDNSNPEKPRQTPEWITFTNALDDQTIQCIANAGGSGETLYAGTFNGVWKSLDSGKTWASINEGLSGLDVRALAVLPAMNDILFCGTWGKGLFISTDAGQTWHSRWPDTQDPRVQVISLSPHADNQVWVGTENGLYMSDDLGATWSKFLYGKITAIGIHPVDPNFILVGIRFYGQVRSRDAGKTWEQVNDGIHHNDSGYVWANTILYNSGNADEILIDTNGYKDIYRSQDGGEHWLPFADALNPYDVSVLLQDPSHVQSLWAATQDRGVWRSQDGGVTWKEWNQGLTVNQIMSLDLVNSPDPVMLAGTVGHGIYKFVEP